MNQRLRLIRLTPALPCGSLTRDGCFCGAPAQLANAQCASDGQWLILPICPACAAAMNIVYRLSEPERPAAQKRLA